MGWFASAVIRTMHVIRLSAWKKAAIWLGSLFVKLLCATLRCTLTDEAGFLTGPFPKPVVMLVWHNRILGMPTIFRRYYPRRKGLLVLTSASRDGAYLSEFVRNFGMGSVRGSSSRRAAAALLDLVRKLEEGYDLCITPDGPRGPKYKLGAGAVLLSQRCQVPLMPFLIEYSAYWRLKSWDGFAIPKPLARMQVTILPLIEIPATDSDFEFEAQRQRIERVMTERMQMY
jgi:lysophospholipid acyltransferase (LPLAT)-like uncharacterized protein